jgi:hypothetical protein
VGAGQGVDASSRRLPSPLAQGVFLAVFERRDRSTVPYGV